MPVETWHAMSLLAGHVSTGHVPTGHVSTGWLMHTNGIFICLLFDYSSQNQEIDALRCFKGGKQMGYPFFLSMQIMWWIVRPLGEVLFASGAIWVLHISWILMKKRN